MSSFDPSGQDSWERVVSTAHSDMRRAYLSHNPVACSAEMKRLQDELANANARINELERASFTDRR